MQAGDAAPSLDIITTIWYLCQWGISFVNCQSCHRLIDLEAVQCCRICKAALCPGCYEEHMRRIYPLGKPNKKSIGGSHGPGPRTAVTG